ncbi:MAG: NupC/NupG family nucleoside CNT transporter [Spartobacteria bacterium]|nr:NupC/NupG family nucleoside CNT transporter [Spartobacteria bacterium]
MTIYNLISLVGIVVIIGLAFLFSTNKKQIKWRPVFIGLFCEFLFAFLIMRTEPGQRFFNFISDAIMKVLNFAFDGISFVFGPLYSSYPTNAPFIFVALIPIVFFGSLINVMYHFGIMQKIVKLMAGLFTRMLGLSSAEALGVASNVFLGQTQAPLVVAPFVKRMTTSELFLTMVGGMATVAGSLLIAYAAMGARLSYVLAASIMAAPGAIIIAKIMIPETEVPETAAGGAEISDDVETVNFLEAIATGAQDGWKVAIGVAVMLLSFVSVIYFLNYLIGFASYHVAHLFGADFRLTLDILLGWLFTPVAWILGVPVADAHNFAVLIGEKTAFNEFIAYGNLKDTVLSPRAYMMVCFALTGFANFSSIAIQIGGLGEIAPSRRQDIARLGLRAVLAGAMTNLMSAAIAGVLYMGE